MEASRIASQRTWFAVDPDGKEHELTLVVEVPELQPGGEWSARILMGVLDTKPRRIAGVDSWQATYEAMRFIALRLEHFSDDGWSFFWERNRKDPATSKDLGFPTS